MCRQEQGPKGDKPEEQSEQESIGIDAPIGSPLDRILLEGGKVEIDGQRYVVGFSQPIIDSDDNNNNPNTHTKYVLFPEND